MSQIKISEESFRYYDTEQEVIDYIEIEAEKLGLDLENSKCYMDRKTRDFVVSDSSLKDEEYMYLCDYESGQIRTL